MQAGRTSFKFLRRIAAPVAVLAVALALRVLAAGVLQWFVQKNVPNRLCVFPDTQYYWQLAKTIRAGSAYEIVEWGSISHRALRTPGYPLFLAACQAIFGEWSLGVRLVQAVLGTLSVGLVYLLTQRLVQCRGLAQRRVFPHEPHLLWLPAWPQLIPITWRSRNCCSPKHSSYRSCWQHYGGLPYSVALAMIRIAQVSQSLDSVI